MRHALYAPTTYLAAGVVGLAFVMAPACGARDPEPWDSVAQKELSEMHREARVQPPVEVFKVLSNNQNCILAEEIKGRSYDDCMKGLAAAGRR